MQFRGSAREMESSHAGGDLYGGRGTWQHHGHFFSHVFEFPAKRQDGVVFLGCRVGPLFEISYHLENLRCFCLFY